MISFAMLIPLTADFFIGNNDWQAFSASLFLTLFIGVSLILTCRQDKIKDVTVREAFILTSLSWLALVFFAALPFYFSELSISFTDAFFESMSGLTTTGATILSGLDFAPAGILIWRAILEWVGGIGIIVMAIAVLPLLRIGGMQLFRTESSDKNDKILPRARQMSLAISKIYLCFTLICAVSYYVAGMSFFDATLHAMTTVSTGGFSTHDSSIGFYNSQTIELVAIFFMILGALPFLIYIKMLRGDIKSLFTDNQIIFFFSMLMAFILLSIYWLVEHKAFDLAGAIRLASFNIVSIMTTTGFASANYNVWGEFMLILFFMLTVVGGCTGSTTGGIKIFRFQILYIIAKYQIFKLVQPHGIYRIQYNKHIVSETVSSAVLSFFILFCLCFFVITMLLAISGLDFTTSLSAAAASLANVGPGLGDIIGPTGNYGSINDFSKWVLALAMLVGRLEIFTILVLFSKIFWKD
jgi:trk system potassium uptake protein TrkH